MKPCTNCDEKGFELAHSYRVCPVCRGTHSVPTDTSKAINIKENDDGTLSPIDPSKPSSFGPTPDQPQADELDTLVNNFIKAWIPASFAHMVDTDDNPGERLRQSLRNLITREREQAKREVLEVERQKALATFPLSNHLGSFLDGIDQAIAALTPNEPKEAE